MRDHAEFAEFVHLWPRLGSAIWSTIVELLWVTISWGAPSICTPLTTSFAHTSRPWSRLTATARRLPGYLSRSGSLTAPTADRGGNLLTKCVPSSCHRGRRQGDPLAELYMLGNAVQGWFELRTVNDLLRKLDRDFEKLKQHPHDVDLAFNFFVTAEHMLDWQYPGKANRSQRDKARRKDVLLQITSHLANGAKHFKVEAKHHQAVRDANQSSGHWPKGYWPKGYWPPGYWSDLLYVELEGDAAAELGQRVGVLQLAERVLKNWQNRLSSAA